ncbi:MAG TPA: hypothetical protein G4N96_02010 [Chloroflexi bacterium]|nr:hypothetical protein [Chloroflexota bacterium]
MRICEFTSCEFVHSLFAYSLFAHSPIRLFAIRPFAHSPIRLMQYLITVKSQGSVVAEHTVEAPDALSAANQVELRYGEPVKIEHVTVELEDGRKRASIVVHNWHGYCFHARRVK